MSQSNFSSGKKRVGNKIEACMEFSYQGKSYAPCIEVDLDKLMAQSGQLPDWHRYIAKQHRIDTYSYLFEVMEAHEIIFKNPTGIAASCFEDGHFDWRSFETRWREQQELEQIQSIAKQYLGIEDINRDAKLKAALLAAYHAGQSKR